MTNAQLLHPHLHHHHLHGDDDAEDAANAQMDSLLEEARRAHPDFPTAPLSRPAPSQDLAPVVLVEGFFSFFNEFFWGPIETHLNASRSSKGLEGNRRIIFARCGPVSSMHDRACELYYTLKGGRVDYGEAHAREFGHARYGRNFEKGAYPSWSPEHPVHFVAHSLGGLTVTVMQTLIAEGHFPGAHPDMIASINSVGAPFRGTSYAYLLGKSYQNSIDTRFFSVDSMITKSVLMLSWFKPLIPRSLPLPDWFADARQLTMAETSMFKLMKQLWKSDWGEGKDVISFDSTFEGARTWDERWQDPGPNTFYRSYVCCMTKREKPHSSYHVPSYKSPLLESIFLYVFASTVGKFDYRTVRPLPYFYKPGYQLQPTLAPHLVPSLEPSYASAATSTFMSRSTTNNSSSTETNSSSSSSSDIDDILVDNYITPRRLTGTRIALSEDFYANDGVVPLFSQWHPGPCSTTRCMHHSTLSQPHPSPFFFGLPASAARVYYHSSQGRPYTHSMGLGLGMGAKERIRPASSSSSASARGVKPGVWNVCHVPDSTHVSLMPMWLGTQRQKEFWIEIGEWLERVDQAREEMGIGRVVREVGEPLLAPA